MEAKLTRRAVLALAGACVALVAALGLAGCSSGTSASDSADTASEEPQTVTVTSLNANKEEVEVEVPYDPQRVAILDLASLDILDDLGVGDRVVGSADTSIDYLQDYANNPDIENLGTIKEADMEAVMACEPDVIFIGARLAASYDELSKIAPVVYLATDNAGKGLVESVRDNATTIASIFGLEDEVADKMAGFDERIAALQQAAEGKTALVGMCTSGSFNVLGTDGRCSIISDEIGFDNVAVGTDLLAASNAGGSGRGGQGGGSGSGGGQGVTATHGNESSFETIVSLDPDYIFVMDRDAAIGTDGAQLAQDIMNNELINSTRAAQDGHIVYLEHPAVWYTAEGGIQALDTMLSDLEDALL